MVRSSLILLYNSLEAREDLVEEVSHQFYKESIQAQKDIVTVFLFFSFITSFLPYLTLAFLIT